MSDNPSTETEDRDEDLAHLFIGHGRCTYLLVAMLTMIAAYPYFENSRSGRTALAVVMLSILLAAIYAVGRRTTTLAIGAVLAASIAVFFAIYAVSAADDYFALRNALQIAFYGFAVFNLLVYMLQRGPVTADKLHAAFSAFMLIATLWATIYTLLEHLLPGSFAFAKPVGTEEPGLFFHFFYFSYTTLTSTGYGDIVPVTDKARSLAILEQLFGIFFIAVLIARLAGIYPPHSQKSRG